MNASSCCVPGAATTVCVRLCRPPKVAGKVMASTCRQAGGQAAIKWVQCAGYSFSAETIAAAFGPPPTHQRPPNERQTTHLHQALVLPPLDDAVAGFAVWHRCLGVSLSLCPLLRGSMAARVGSGAGGRCQSVNRAARKGRTHATSSSARHAVQTVPAVGTAVGTAAGPQYQQ